MGRMEELEKKIVEYEETFEELKAIDKPATRYGKLTQLLVRYTNDNDVIQLATNYSYGSWHNVLGDKLDKLVKIQRNIITELMNYELERTTFTSDRERLRFILSRLGTGESTVLERIRSSYFAKQFQIRPEDLNKRIGAQLTVPALD